MSGFPNPRSPRFASRATRLVGHSIGFILAALIAWAIWRGYQNPDLLLDLAAFKLC